MDHENNEWVILEAMGHNRVAGRYFFENGLHRVDVPDCSPGGGTKDRFIRTERYGPGSIFRITSVDEATARIVARQSVIPEAIPWDVRRELNKLAGPMAVQEHLPEPGLDFDDDNGDGYDSD